MVGEGIHLSEQLAALVALYLVDLDLLEVLVDVLGEPVLEVLHDLNLLSLELLRVVGAHLDVAGGRVEADEAAADARHHLGELAVHDEAGEPGEHRLSLLEVFFRLAFLDEYLAASPDSSMEEAEFVGFLKEKRR